MNFQVELTSYCDLTCGYCPNKDMKRERKFMSDEVWDVILNKYIIPYRQINTWNPPTFIGHKDGEPLLNKKLPDRLRSLPADMKIDIYSHGLMLPKLAAQGKDFIDFLGTLPNRVRYMMSYHPFNHDGSLNNYTPVVSYLKGKLNNQPQNVEFISVSHKSKWVSEELQSAWKSKWWDEIHQNKITVHSNCSINPWTGLIEEATCKYQGCPYADFGHWFFGATGNIIACCLDLEEEIVLGNVMKDDPDEMFEVTDEFYQVQRKRWDKREYPQYDVCANCFGFERKDLIQLGRLC